MTLLNQFETHFNQYLTPAQFQTLSILLGLLNQYKQVKIEKQKRSQKIDFALRQKQDTFFTKEVIITKKSQK